MKLSILVPTLTKRALLLKRLMSTIQPHPLVEILTEIDNGEITTGEKRNILLKRATGEYVAFIDDDDKVMPNYVSSILRALDKNPDAIGFKGWMTTDGRNRLEWRISKNFKYERKGHIYYRYNNHLSPIRRELALMVGYPHLTIGEDYAYAKKLHDLQLVKTEVFINDFLYLYDYKTHK